MSKKDEPSVKDQLAQLDTIIAWFDQDNFDLDEALERFEQGVALAEVIKKRLQKLENKITILKERFDQPLGTDA